MCGALLYGAHSVMWLTFYLLMADLEDRNELDDLLGDMKKLSVEEQEGPAPLKNYAHYDSVSGRVRLMQSLGVPAERSEHNSRVSALLVNPDAEGWMVRDLFAPPGARSSWDQWERYLAAVNQKMRNCDLRRQTVSLVLPVPLNSKQKRSLEYAKMLPLGITPCYVAAIGLRGHWRLLYAAGWP